MEIPSAEDAGDVDHGGVSPNGEAIGDLSNGTTSKLTNLELSLACFSEKVANLSIFVMHLETLEGELEALVLDKENMDMDCFGKGMEFDLLCGLLDSEARELEGFLDTLHAEIDDAGERVSSCNLWQDKLRDCEQCLKQSEDQFSEIKKQSVRFQRTLSSYKREENDNVEEGEIVREDDQSLNVNTVIKMQTIEQQRHILRMLEKSLANEMDLEKNLNDSRQIEERLKLRIISLEQELILMEEEATDVWERWFEADNAYEILMGISRDLLGRLQISQFNLNGLSQRERELRAKLETSIEQLKDRDVTLDKIESSSAEDKLILVNSEVVTLSDKVCSLEKQLKESECQLLNVKASADEYQKQYNIMCSEIREMENLIVELKNNVSNAESRANTAEAECKLLTETNDELNKELALLKDGGGTSERVESLERQLRESDLQLQHAEASAEASQEKQSMLCSTIKDMEHVIKDLKSKVSKAESRADNAEEKCIILSESNADLNEEVSFLRSRLECLEGSLHQVEEAKVATAKDIGKRTKVFKNLVTQLAVERERLNKQLSSLASENKILIVKLNQTYKDPSQEVGVTLVSDNEVDRTWKNLSANDDEVKFADSMPDVGTVRRIDAGVLNFKHLFILVFALLVSALTYLYFEDVNVDVSL
ncbi:WPP domain-interacting tail-anchored protein 1-like [Gastrolobium bilobum]|uniref:WPP domain-interacting tail-anchored protein 1-like n=1 Tax=Gastrolobium bilobum TaxID=150636 RepID=UPI002AB02E5B|nr:WPP domain-interacting tail-anchored protein 1-like [Gastrolobium bilobum]